MMKRSVKSVHIMTGKLVIAAVLASSLAGCGVKEDVLLEESGAVIDTRVNSAQEDDTNVGMGRYVEKMCLLWKIGEIVIFKKQQRAK